MKKIIGLILVWILILEGSLQLTAFAVSLWSRKNQEIKTSQSAQKTILCIGESTTAWGAEGSYPSLLQKRLDEVAGVGQYQVVNKGMAGVSTRVILNNLPDFLEEFQPQKVIVMTGVNNYWSTIDKDAPWWEISLEKISHYSRIAKFASNISANVKFDKKNNYTSAKVLAADCGTHTSEIDLYAQRADTIRKTGDAKKTIDYLNERLEILTSQGTCSVSDVLQVKISELQEVELKNPKLALETIDKLLELDLIPHTRYIFAKRRNDLREKLKLSTDNNLLVNADNYWENETYKNDIQNIIGEMQKRKIPVIMMQYPRLPLGPIKKILVNHEGVAFVENKKNFEEKLKKLKFDDLFLDTFGVVFGHFTPAGSELVVDNVIAEVLNGNPGSPGFHQ